ncbi:SEC14-like protein 5, partial [Hondaea fermentalgiana]
QAPRTARSVGWFSRRTLLRAAASRDVRFASLCARSRGPGPAWTQLFSARSIQVASCAFVHVADSGVEQGGFSRPARRGAADQQRERTRPRGAAACSTARSSSSSMVLGLKKHKDKKDKASWNVELGDSVEEWQKRAAEEVAALRKEVATDIQEAGDVGTKTDDLFLLRFVLSSEGDVSKAAKQVRGALAWRKEHAKSLQQAVQGGHELQSRLSRYQCAAFCGALGDDKHPLFLVRAGVSDMKAMMRNMSLEDATMALAFSNEIGFQICDARTRKSGKFIKMITGVHAAGFAMSRFDPKFVQALGKSSHLSQMVYPQLLGMQVLVSLPSPIRFIMRMVNKLQNKRAVEKQKLCPGHGADDCPFLSRWKALDQVPQMMGGKKPDDECPVGLIPFAQRPNVTIKEVAAESSLELATAATPKRQNLFEVFFHGKDSGARINVQVKQHDKVLTSATLGPAQEGFASLSVIPETEGSLSVVVSVHNSQSPCTIEVAQHAEMNFINRSDSFLAEVDASAVPTGSPAIPAETSPAATSA